MQIGEMVSAERNVVNRANRNTDESTLGLISKLRTVITMVSCEGFGRRNSLKHLKKT